MFEFADAHVSFLMAHVYRTCSNRTTLSHTYVHFADFECFQRCIGIASIQLDLKNKILEKFSTPESPKFSLNKLSINRFFEYICFVLGTMVRFEQVMHENNNICIEFDWIENSEIAKKFYVNNCMRGE